MTRPLAETVATLARLIGAPTVSSAGNLELVWYLAERLESAGARVEVSRDPSGAKANLFATAGPDRTDGGLVLAGHTDVVPVADQAWASDPFDMAERDDRLYGRGTCDMKGFVACVLAMAEELVPLARERPLHFAFTYDEEVGCFGARQLTDELGARGLRPGLAIVGEPTSMAVVDGHEGCCEYTTRFTGLEGHGSAPDAGVNAVEYAARFAARLIELREELKGRAPQDSRFDPPWTTINIGRIGGGHAHNVIAGRAEIDWEMRPVAGADAEFVKVELDRYVVATLLPAMRAVATGADIATEVIGEVAGLDPAGENAARSLALALTGAGSAGCVAFGTEAGLYQGLGIDTVVCGPGSIAQAHKPDEYIEIAQLAACLDMLERLKARLA